MTSHIIIQTLLTFKDFSVCLSEKLWSQQGVVCAGELAGLQSQNEQCNRHERSYAAETGIAPSTHHLPHNRTTKGVFHVQNGRLQRAFPTVLHVPGINLSWTLWAWPAKSQPSPVQHGEAKSTFELLDLLCHFMIFHFPPYDIWQWSIAINCLPPLSKDISFIGQESNTPRQEEVWREDCAQETEGRACWENVKVVLYNTPWDRRKRSVETPFLRRQRSTVQRSLPSTLLHSSVQSLGDGRG